MFKQALIFCSFSGCSFFPVIFVFAWRRHVIESICVICAMSPINAVELECECVCLLVCQFEPEANRWRRGSAVKVLPISLPIFQLAQAK